VFGIGETSPREDQMGPLILREKVRAAAQRYPRIVGEKKERAVKSGDYAAILGTDGDPYKLGDDFVAARKDSNKFLDGIAGARGFGGEVPFGVKANSNATRLLFALKLAETKGLAEINVSTSSSMRSGVESDIASYKVSISSLGYAKQLLLVIAKEAKVAEDIVARLETVDPTNMTLDADALALLEFYVYKQVESGSPLVNGAITADQVKKVIEVIAPVRVEPTEKTASGSTGGVGEAIGVAATKAPFETDTTLAALKTFAEKIGDTPEKREEMIVRYETSLKKFTREAGFSAERFFRKLEEELTLLASPHTTSIAYTAEKFPTLTMLAKYWLHNNLKSLGRGALTRAQLDAFESVALNSDLINKLIPSDSPLSFDLKQFNVLMEMIVGNNSLNDTSDITKPDFLYGVVNSEGKKHLSRGAYYAWAKAHESDNPKYLGVLMDGMDDTTPVIRPNQVAGYSWSDDGDNWNYAIKFTPPTSVGGGSSGGTLGEPAVSSVGTLLPEAHPAVALRAPSSPLTVGSLCSSVGLTTNCTEIKDLYPSILPEVIKRSLSSYRSSFINPNIKADRVGDYARKPIPVMVMAILEKITSGDHAGQYRLKIASSQAKTGFEDVFNVATQNHQLSPDALYYFPSLLEATETVDLQFTLILNSAGIDDLAILEKSLTAGQKIVLQIDLQAE